MENSESGDNIFYIIIKRKKENVIPWIVSFCGNPGDKLYLLGKLILQALTRMKSPDFMTATS